MVRKISSRVSRLDLENNGYEHVLKYSITKSKWFDVYRAPDDYQVLPWCITYAGSGKYWKTVHDCFVYGVGRGWIQQGQIEELERSIGCK